MKNSDRITLYAASPAHAKQVALVLHSVLGLSLSETIRRANVGEQLAHIFIWGNDHDESAAQLRAILDAAPDALVFEVITPTGDGTESADRESAESILGLLEVHDARAAARGYDAEHAKARELK